ncbi:MAG TPA: ABC transporter ATP-binding protein [Symbiobacteriaceae bacterium]|jgi:branched-chain amino acid transport system ATP-binding protein|nr:ABC transporter ATP-binding protein [Symbiobacteriaceae bacterium]
MTVLRIEGLQVWYGAVAAVRGIDLTVAEGEIVSLIGANGAGKSSALRAISGLVRPKGGTIQFQGRAIQGLRPDQITALGLSQVPEGRAVLTRMTVRENLLMGAYTRRDREVEADLKRVLERFGRLGERQGQLAGTLSGGEQQMVVMGRALMARPKLLLLDEPSMGLAPLVVQEVLRTVVEMNRAGTTVLLVEQNARQALKIAHRAYVLETGQIVLSGEAGELARDPRVVQAYLGGRSAG